MLRSVNDRYLIYDIIITNYPDKVYKKIYKYFSENSFFLTLLYILSIAFTWECRKTGKIMDGNNKGNKKRLECKKYRSSGIYE